MKLSEQLIYIRSKYDLAQSEAAKIACVSKGGYQAIERGTTSDQSKMARRIRKNIIENEHSIREYFEAKRRENDRHRIPNIPDFYQRLDSLCDEEGRLRKDADKEVLKELQRDLGVLNDKVDTDIPSTVERKKFADLLKEYRGNIVKTEFARRLGVTMGSYNAIETRLRSSDSKVMQGLLVNEYFTKAQRRQLQRVYDRMKRKEMLE